MKKNIKLAETTCPNCKAEIDAATVIDGGTNIQPSSGDFTICAYCGSFLIYNCNLQTELMTSETIAQLDYKTRSLLSKVRKAILNNVLD